MIWCKRSIKFLNHFSFLASTVKVLSGTIHHHHVHQYFSFIFFFNGCSVHVLACTGTVYTLTLRPEIDRECLPCSPSILFCQDSVFGWIKSSLIGQSQPTILDWRSPMSASCLLSFSNGFGDLNSDFHAWVVSGKRSTESSSQHSLNSFIDLSNICPLKN